MLDLRPVSRILALSGEAMTDVVMVQEGNGEMWQKYGGSVVSCILAF